MRLVKMCAFYCTEGLQYKCIMEKKDNGCSLVQYKCITTGLPMQSDRPFLAVVA